MTTVAVHHRHTTCAVRLASCYCRECRVGSYGTCLLASVEGVGGLVGQPQDTAVRETLAAAEEGGGSGGGGGGSGGAKKRKRASAPTDSQAETVAPSY